MIDEWAKEFGVSDVAIAALKVRMGIADHYQEQQTIGEQTGSEARQQALVMLEAAQLKIRLFRNNSGAFIDPTNREVRFGLGNVSKQWNAVFKSPDLVGWRRRIITPEMVGSVIGQASMREMKHEGWTFNPKDKHEVAQLAFLQLAVADGCDAAFATGPGTL